MGYSDSDPSGSFFCLGEDILFAFSRQVKYNYFWV